MQVACQCTHVSFSTPPDQERPLAVYHCHCTECRAQTASVYGTSAIFRAFPLPETARSRLRLWTRPTDSGGSVDCFFCERCGVRVYHRGRDADGKPLESVSIKGGLVQGLDFKGAIHIYTRSAVVPIPEGVEKWDAAPDVYVGE